jgi:hypothetical protein
MKVIEIPNEHIFAAVSVNGKISDNLKPIKVDDYWVVVDTKAKLQHLNWVFDPIGNKAVQIYNPLKKNNFGAIKIIASIGKLIDKSIPIIKFVEQSVEKEILTNLCYYDLRNPDGIKETLSEEFGYDKEEIASYGEFSKLDCGCDNCFYGRTKLATMLYNQAKSSDKKYTEEEAKIIWKGGQEYWKTSGNSITFEELTEKLKNQPKLPDVINLQMECTKNGIKEEGSSCSLNNNCFYPNCLIIKTTLTSEGEVIEIKI